MGSRIQRLEGDVGLLTGYFISFSVTLSSQGKGRCCHQGTQQRLHLNRKPPPRHFDPMMTNRQEKGLIWLKQLILLVQGNWVVSTYGGKVWNSDDSLWHLLVLPCPIVKVNRKPGGKQCFTPIVPATREAEAELVKFRSLGSSWVILRPCLKKKTHTLRWENKNRNPRRMKVWFTLPSEESQLANDVTETKEIQNE
jgi:hypothetical protein